MNRSKNFRIVITSITMTGFLYGLSIGMYLVIGPLYFEGHGLNKSHISLLVAADVCTPLFIMPLLPGLIARIGFKKLLFGGLILRNAMLAAIGLLNGMYFWLPNMFLFGIGGFTLFTLLQLWVNKICTNQNRGLFLGVMNASLSTGIAVGPNLLILTGLDGYVPFLISSTLSLCAIFPLVWANRLMPQKIVGFKSNILVVIKESPSAIIGGITVDYIYFSLTTFLVLYGLGHGLTPDRAPFLITAMLIGGILFDIPLGYLSDKMNRKIVVMVCSVIVLICSQILPFTIESNYVFTLIILSLLCGAMSGIYTSSIAILGDNYKDMKLSAANSAFAFMNCIGGVLGAGTTGITMDFIGNEGLTYSISAICIISLLLTIKFYNFKVRKEYE